MSVRNTADFGKARAAMLAAGRELQERMGHYLEGAAKRYAPVDTGELWNSITLVSSGITPSLVSGSVVAAIGEGSGGGGTHVVAYASHALFVEYGSYHGHTWVPPNPFMRNAIADTIGAFSEIVRMEVFAPFRAGSGWTEIETQTDAGTANTMSPLPGPATP